MKHLKIASAVAVLTLGSLMLVPGGSDTAHAGTNCEGNACDEVSFKFSGGCYRVTNHSNRRVSVRMGATTLRLKPGETQKLINYLDKYKRCLPAYVGKTTANYS